MTNLYVETIHAITRAGFTLDDIAYIGTDPSASGPHYSCSWKKFKTLANREYDSGWGSAKVAYDLVIIFKNGDWLERGEYDGSEWWELKRVLKVPAKTKSAAEIFCETVS